MTLFYIDKADQDNSTLFKTAMVSCLKGQAYMGVVLLILVLLFFRDKPKTPPSATSDIVQEGFVTSIKALFSNRNMIFLTLALG